MEPLKDRLVTALGELAADLLEIGIPSSPNPAEVRVTKTGAAWLHPFTIEQTRLHGGGVLRVEIWLVIADPDNPWAELLTLTDLLDRALSLPYLAPVEPVELDAQLALPDNPSLPAARLVVDLDL